MPAYDFEISNELFEWRGPAPFYFVAIESGDSAIIKKEAKVLSYGWGIIPVHGRIGNTDFSTALIPKDGKYYIPIKDAVRKSEKIEVGEQVKVSLNLGKAPKG